MYNVQYMRTAFTWEYVLDNSTKVGNCLVWNKTLNNGYSRISLAEAVELAGSNIGHRAVYKMMKGDIPAGMELDHTCATRACVNPNHLQPVTRKENNRRRDHLFIKDNPYFPCGHKRTETGRWRKSGYQSNTKNPKRAFYCYPCALDTNRKRKEKKNATANRVY